MITTTTTPSAETPSATTPSAIPSANSKDEPCPVCTYNSIQLSSKLAWVGKVHVE